MRDCVLPGNLFDASDTFILSFAFDSVSSRLVPSKMKVIR
jgi:hypothetical protein